MRNLAAPQYASVRRSRLASPGPGLRRRVGHYLAPPQSRPPSHGLQRTCRRDRCCPAVNRAYRPIGLDPPNDLVTPLRKLLQDQPLHSFRANIELVVVHRHVNRHHCALLPVSRVADSGAAASDWGSFTVRRVGARQTRSYGVASENGKVLRQGRVEAGNHRSMEAGLSAVRLGQPHWDRGSVRWGGLGGDLRCAGLRGPNSRVDGEGLGLVVAGRRCSQCGHGLDGVWVG